jgi:hypothetical protein
VAVVVGRERGKREQIKKKEEEELRPNRYRDKGVSLIGVLLCYKGANGPVDVACSSNPAESIGHHHPWCLMPGFRYEISFFNGLSVKIVFSKRLK